MQHLPRPRSLHPREIITPALRLALTQVPRSQWNVDDIVQRILCLSRLNDELQIADNLANGHALMSVDHACKRDARLLPGGCLAQQILVLTEKEPPEGVGTVEQGCVVDLMMVVVIGRQHIHATGTQRPRNAGVDMVVHIELEHLVLLRSGCPAAFARPGARAASRA